MTRIATVTVACPDCDGAVQTDPCRRCWGAGSVIQFILDDEIDSFVEALAQKSLDD